MNRNIRLQPGTFWKFHELRPHANFDAYWNFAGLMETGRLHLDQHWQLRAGHEFHTGMNLNREGVITPFDTFRPVFVPAGNYEESEAQLVAFTNQGAPLSTRMRLTFGGFFGGSRVVVAPQVRFRISDVFNTEVNWSRNDISLPGGASRGPSLHGLSWGRPLWSHHRRGRSMSLHAVTHHGTARRPMSLHVATHPDRML